MGLRLFIAEALTMSKKNLELGRLGEQEAADFLRRQGYKIITKNYKTKFGEIDIIAQDKNALVFIEVKARCSNAFGEPQEAVNKFKQIQISKAALTYLKNNSLLDSPARFDIVSVLYVNVAPEINLIKNAFELDSRYLY